MAEEDTRPRSQRSDPAGLASSSPDLNWGVINVARYLFRAGKEKPWLAPIAWPLATILVLSIVVFVTALPTISGMTIWADKKADSDASRRAYEIEKLKVTATIEASKLAAEREGGAKLDEVLQATQQTNVTVRAVADGLQRVSKKQDELARRVNKIEAAGGGDK